MNLKEGTLIRYNDIVYKIIKCAHKTPEESLFYMRPAAPAEIEGKHREDFPKKITLTNEDEGIELDLLIKKTLGQPNTEGVSPVIATDYIIEDVRHKCPDR